MVIIKMKGGLGNQLFQYALYLELKSRGREVKIDDITGFRDDAQRNPALGVLGIKYNRATMDEYIEITDSYMDMASRIRRKLTGRKTLEYNEKDGNFDEAVLEMKNAYLVGFWQSDKYFENKEVRKNLRGELLAPKEQIIEKAGMNELLEQIRSTEAVSVHIRRGDYLQEGTVETFGGICTGEYYLKAMEHVRRKCPSAVFYIFSNDIAWVKRHYTGDDIVCVEMNEENFAGGNAAVEGTLGGEGDISDNEKENIQARFDAAEMYLMSECRHHILANSSFSWWSAWLSEVGADHMILAPDKWLNTKEMNDIYTPYMTKIHV